ncbi:hypothetical protein OC835_003155 [Tilletia horrida]|nr:hypothetical protein OC835_003155 [Tilletia horrida]
MDGIGAEAGLYDGAGPAAGPSRTPPRAQQPQHATPTKRSPFNGSRGASSSSSSPASATTSPQRKRRRIDVKGKGKATIFSNGLAEDDEDEADDELPPVIIALDVDCFYAQACRIRDPTLNGLPLGVQQKTILAAVSYEARALGVPKIVSMREALRILPTLTIVNGEDLSYFRLLSNRNWRLLRSLVWDERVERCGMDELWSDCTPTIDDHLLRCQLGTVHRDDRLGIFFSFDRLPLDELQPVDTARGFWYNTSDPIPGFFQPSDHSFKHGWPPDPWRQRYALGAHIAVFFRRIIKERVNLACSGGISFSKQLAKLCCSENKPDKQTCFCPVRPLSVDDDVTVRAFRQKFLADAQDYIDPMDLGKLNGFGHVYVKKLEEVYQSQDPASARAAEDRPSEFDWLYGHSDSVKAKHRLTVNIARRIFTATQFDSFFGSTIGPRLWAILHANDTESVAIASDFAHQMSIEDTYRNLKGTPVIAEMRKLSESLIKRMEVECVEMPDEAWIARSQRTVLETIVVPAEEDAVAGGREEKVLTQVRNYVDVEEEEEEPPPPHVGGATKSANAPVPVPRPRTWRRYPLSVRLSLRIGWGARFSRTGRMPIGIFDLTQPRKERAQTLLGTVLALFRHMTASRDISEGFNLINIAALDLSKSAPATNDIKNMLARASNVDVERNPYRAPLRAVADVRQADEAQRPAPVLQRASASIDMQMLRELPADIAAEVAQEYGIPWPPPAESAPISSPMHPLEPTELSVQSFSPPPRSTPTTPLRPYDESDEPAATKHHEEAEAEAVMPPVFSPSSPHSKPSVLPPVASSRKFGHFELSGYEMSAEELEHFLAPPSPPLLASSPPSPLSPPPEDDQSMQARPVTESVGGDVAYSSFRSSSEDEKPAGAAQGSELDRRDWEQQVCAQCGRRQKIWLQHDHDVFGESGLPPGMAAAAAVEGMDVEAAIAAS